MALGNARGAVDDARRALVEALHRRLEAGEVVGSGYPEPLSLHRGRIVIPPGDWRFLTLDKWASAAVERHEVHSGRGTVFVERFESYWYTTMPAIVATEMLKPSDPADRPRGVVTWLLFSDGRKGKGVSAKRSGRGDAEERLRRWFGEQVKSHGVKKTWATTKAALLGRARKALGLGITDDLFNRVWASLAPDEWRAQGLPRGKPPKQNET